MDSHSSSKSGASFFRTCFNGVNALSGIGMVSIPYAVAQGGWVSLILLLMVAGACFFTGLLLKRCMDSNSLAKTYPDIGELAFGSKGRALVASFMYLELLFVATEFLILEGDNLNNLFPEPRHWTPPLLAVSKPFIVLSALLVLPSTWLRNLGILAYVSAGGILASLVLTASVSWAGAVDGVGFRGRGTPLRWTGIPSAVSFFAFCYSAHAVYPTLYASMADKTKFSRVLLLCFAVCTINYGAMAVIGYLMFGEDTKSQITLNLPVEKISSKIAIYTTLMNPLTKYALVLTPVAEAIEDLLRASKNRFFGVLIRTLLVVCTAIVALTVPFFGYVVALTGSFLCSSATMVLPCLCYVKIFKRSMCWSVESAVIIAIVLMGVFVAVVGTCVSMKQIITSL